MIRDSIQKLSSVVSDQNAKMLQYAVLKNEAQADTDLYNLLLTRLKEAGVTAGLKSSNIRIVDQARVLVYRFIKL